MLAMRRHGRWRISTLLVRQPCRLDMGVGNDKDEIVVIVENACKLPKADGDAHNDMLYGLPVADTAASKPVALSFALHPFLLFFSAEGETLMDA
jgi:hypothetical protein